MANDVVYGWDGKNRVPLNQLVLATDIQGIKPQNKTDYMPVRIVDANGDPINTGGGGTSEPLMEFTTIVNALALRTGALATVDLPDLSKYKAYEIYVLSTLDVDVKIAPWRTSYLPLSDGTVGRWACTTATDKLNYAFVVPARDTGNIGSGAHWLSEHTPVSVDAGTVQAKPRSGLFTRININGLGMLKLDYQAKGSPTAGNLTIRIIGYTR